MLSLISLLCSAPVHAGRAKLHEAARAKYAAHRYKEAADLYAQIRRPGAEVRIEAAWTQLQLRNPEAARGLLAPVLQKPSPPAEALVVGSIADLWRDRPVEAAEQARAALSVLSPGGLLYDLGERALIEALAEPEVCPPRSYCLDELRERAVLLEARLERIGLDEQRPNVLLRLGDVLEALGVATLLEAYEVYDVVMERCFSDPDCDFAAQELDLTESHAWSEAALARYHQLVREHPESEEASQGFSRAGYVLWQDLDREEEALRWLKRAVQLYPDSEDAAGARLIIAEEDLERGRLQEARSGYQALLDESSRYEEYARYKLAWVLLELGDHRGAIEEMTVVSREPGVIAEEAAKDALWFYIAADDVEGALGFIAAHPEAAARRGLNHRLVQRLEDGQLSRDVITVCERLLRDAPLDEAAPSLMLSIVSAQHALGQAAEAEAALAALEAMVAPGSAWCLAGDPAARAEEGALALSRAHRRLEAR